MNIWYSEVLIPFEHFCHVFQQQIFNLTILSMLMILSFLYVFYPRFHIKNKTINAELGYNASKDSFFCRKFSQPKNKDWFLPFILKSVNRMHIFIALFTLFWEIYIQILLFYKFLGLIFLTLRFFLNIVLLEIINQYLLLFKQIKDVEFFIGYY